MQSNRTRALLALVFAAAALPALAAGPFTLDQVATSEQLWTGVAVSREGRIFVNFPRWFPTLPMSVGELAPDGSVQPYPDAAWNEWDFGLPVEDRFVAVQSVYVDADDFLWVLDTGNPFLAGVVPGAPKLVKIDLRSEQVAQVIFFDDSVAPSASYLNDVRVDVRRRFAYLTESGLGSLVVVDLAGATSRRLLADHPSTKSEGIVMIIEGKPVLNPDGTPPDIHADSIALAENGSWLYYKALTARKLYRVHTRWLRDASVTPEKLAQKVQLLAEPGPSDGILMGGDGFIYVTALEPSAVVRLRPHGPVETVVQDARLAWPDSLSMSGGKLYVTTSQLHRDWPLPEPFRLLVIDLR